MHARGTDAITSKAVYRNQWGAKANFRSYGFGELGGRKGKAPLARHKMRVRKLSLRYGFGAAYRSIGTP